jgi:hypothetical protein
MRDSDGEFLLIEAANDLPAWVSPENAENRVSGCREEKYPYKPQLWLHNGHLHLLPLSIRSSASSRSQQIPDMDDEDDGKPQTDAETWISEEDAIKAVRTDRHRADNNLEGAVWERIDWWVAVSILLIPATQKRSRRTNIALRHTYLSPSPKPWQFHLISYNGPSRASMCGTHLN